MVSFIVLAIGSILVLEAMVFVSFEILQRIAKFEVDYEVGIITGIIDANRFYSALRIVVAFSVIIMAVTSIVMYLYYL